MHGIKTFLLWTAICVVLLLIERWIPKQESAFRLMIALTWVLWIVVGIAYGMRGVWRFMRS